MTFIYQNNENKYISKTTNNQTQIDFSKFLCIACSIDSQKLKKLIKTVFKISLFFSYRRSKPHSRLKSDTKGSKCNFIQRARTQTGGEQEPQSYEKVQAKNNLMQKKRTNCITNTRHAASAKYCKKECSVLITNKQVILKYE